MPSYFKDIAGHFHTAGLQSVRNTVGQFKRAPLAVHLSLIISFGLQRFHSLSVVECWYLCNLGTLWIYW